MIPKRIALKNFLSFGTLDGDKPVEIAFDDDEPLSVLGGENGTGKSAVFDAITYALYGEHRGGTQKAEQLIRHGTNGFEVEFDFEFNGVDYRVGRTRPKKGRTTQHLKRKVNGEWKNVRGTDTAGAVKATDIEKWVEETTGLNHDSFTNSVLLKQGQADKLFTAGRDERLQVLKGIIGFEQYEALAERVGTATGERRAAAKSLTEQLAKAPLVTPEEIAAADASVGAAEETCAAAQAAHTSAAERVGNARGWEQLERTRADLDRKLAEADERHRQGRQIRQDNVTLDDLTAAVPVLQSLFAVRDRLAQAAAAHDAARATFDAETSERDAAAAAAAVARQKATDHAARGERYAVLAKDSAREIEQDEKCLKAADAVAELDHKLSAFPPTLDALLATATQAATAADAAVRTAADRKTEAATKLTLTKESAERHANATAGGFCSHCRQPVDAGHAELERTELAAEVARLRTEFASATTAGEEAAARFATAKKEQDALAKRTADRDALRIQQAARRDALGTDTDAPALREKLAATRTRKADAERDRDAEAAGAKAASAEADRLGKRAGVLAANVTKTDAEVRRLDGERHALTATEEATRGRLSADWQSRLAATTPPRVAELAAERDRLVAAGVAARFKALEDDDALRDEWTKSRDAVAAQLDAVPPADRVTEAAAKAAQQAAEEHLRDATAAHTAAAHQRDALTRQRDEFAKLTADSRAAEERHRLHAKLDKLLGEEGLQLALVRDAEEQILVLANDTLNSLSEGDLSLEVDTDPDAKKTFDLRVRRGGGEPIGVAFLSGSQRFRVAVSIALAVGRFACDRARRLESVIIDEGFGSLDPKGLQAMAGELKSLQQKGGLKRVVLVSHQPDFTDQFSSGFELIASEKGTTVRRVRR